jgi:hypothetical protein
MEGEMAGTDQPIEPGNPEPASDAGFGWGFVKSDADESSSPGSLRAGCRLELVKDGHRYVFAYRPGEEPRVLAGLLEMARDPSCPLEMFDAALLSHQMGVQLSQRIHGMLKQT